MVVFVLRFGSELVLLSWFGSELVAVYVAVSVLFEIWTYEFDFWRLW
jgi:transposase